MTGYVSASHHSLSLVPRIKKFCPIGENRLRQGRFFALSSLPFLAIQALVVLEDKMFDEESKNYAFG